MNKVAKKVTSIILASAMTAGLTLPTNAAGCKHSELTKMNTARVGGYDATRTIHPVINDVKTDQTCSYHADIFTYTYVCRACGTNFDEMSGTETVEIHFNPNCEKYNNFGGVIVSNQIGLDPSELDEFNEALETTVDDMG